MRSRILVVDDDPNSRAVVLAALHDPQWDLVAATDTMSALAALAEGPIEVVLLDRHLAEADGIEFAANLNRDPETSTIPVILISGLADEEARLAGLRAGALDFLDRGIGPAELKAKVAAHTRYGRRVRELSAHQRANQDRTDAAADDDAGGGLVRDNDEMGMHPVFQPIVDVTTGQPVGYEGLSRFADGQPPDTRFRSAARRGNKADLELKALAQQVEASATLTAGAWLAVNLSPSTLHDPRLSHALAVSDRDLVLELTEHERIDDYAAILTALATLPRQPGLAVDDTGAGYASLAHVLGLRPRFVKLDRSWVHGVDTDDARTALIECVHGFATGMGSRVIAEGVETAAELRALAAIGITLVQGFHVGRPSRSGSLGRVITLD